MITATATRPGRHDRDNEDFVAATHSTVVLLDGAGTPPGSNCGCVHGVAWYSRTLGTELLRRATDSPDRDLRDVLALSIEAVASLHKDTCDLQHPGSPSATVMVVRNTGDRLQYLVLADSVLVLHGRNGLKVITDDREAQVGKKFRDRMDELPAGTEAHTEAHRAYVETLRRFRNQPGGFWVASAEPSAAREAIAGEEPLNDLETVVLLSDGSSRLVDRFEQASWSTLVEIAATSPDAVIDRVRHLEAGDPLGKRWPRGKPRDDATVALITDLQPSAMETPVA